MDFGEIMTYIGTALGGGGLTQVVNWRINRNKAKEEVKSDEIENIRKSIDVYQTIISDQNKRITELTQEVNTLREQLRIERNEHQKQIDGLQKQIIEITRVLGMQNRQRIRDEKTGRFQKKEDK
jgi:predicted RNase H-like nuclease (RuvC/YqgF family)